MAKAKVKVTIYVDACPHNETRVITQEQWDEEFNQRVDEYYNSTPMRNEYIDEHYDALTVWNMTDKDKDEAMFYFKEDCKQVVAEEMENDYEQLEIEVKVECESGKGV